MEETNWKYKPVRVIKNYKDLEFEKQRLRLHQKYLGELLESDKVLLKKAIEPQQLFATIMNTVLNQNTSSDTASSNNDDNFVVKILRWIVSRMF